MLGARPVAVRAPDDLDDIAGLVLPGGESTTLSLLMGSSGLFDPIGERLAAGMPVLGTCAGMIMLCAEILDGRIDQRCYAAVDVSVRRNAFGSQRRSFEASLEIAGLDGGPFPGVFIRAPVVERVGPGVDVLATVPGGGQPVLCRQGDRIVAAFHPELSGDLRVHQLFVDAV